MRSKLIIYSLAVFLGVFLLFSSVIKAEDSTDSSDDSNDRPSAGIFGTLRSRDDSDSESPRPFGTPREFERDRLEGKRLQFCENHQDEINTRLDSLGKLVANMLGKFDAIAARVEDYYQSKVLPSGKSVDNYAELIADISAKKTAVEDALASTQADVNGFDCNADNPKAQIRQYRTDMQSVKSALHDYRTSIKNLIVAVRSVVGEGERTASESAEPSVEPSESP